MPRMRDGSIVEDPRFGRLPQVDERSLQYPITALLEVTAAPTTRLWTLPDGAPVLDQGPYGSCVGHGVTNELRFHPYPVPALDSKFAVERVYWPAQQIDPFPGGAYPGANPFSEGTSVLSGIKVVAKMGHYTEYRWARHEGELALAVSQVGPAVIGVDWYAGMARPNSRGYLRPTGSVLGGHCVLVIGINTRYSYYTIYNSWGPNWGKHGTARISRTHMARLLDAGGDACIVTGRATPAR